MYSCDTLPAIPTCNTLPVIHHLRNLPAIPYLRYCTEIAVTVATAGGIVASDSTHTLLQSIAMSASALDIPRLRLNQAGLARTSQGTVSPSTQGSQWLCRLCEASRLGAQAAARAERRDQPGPTICTSPAITCQGPRQNSPVLARQGPT